MTKDWHYAWQGESHGPVSAETMADLIRAGRLRADTLVWSEGMANWDPASAHFDFGAPPPLPAGATGFGTQRMAQGLRTGATGIGPDGLYPGAPRRSFGEAIKVCFTKYITFKGRASRSEYWWFTLFTTLGSAVWQPSAYSVNGAAAWRWMRANRVCHCSRVTDASSPRK